MQYSTWEDASRRSFEGRSVAAVNMRFKNVINDDLILEKATSVRWNQMQSGSSGAASTERPNEIWSIATPMRMSSSEQKLVLKSQSLQETQSIQTDRPCLEWTHDHKFNIMNSAISWESLNSRDYIG